MERYSLENIPNQTSWIHELTAPEALAQCEAWEIPSKETLAENRELLKHFVKNAAKSANKNVAATNTKAEQNAVDAPTGTEVPDVAQMLQQMHRESMKITMDAITQVVSTIGAGNQSSSKRMNQTIISELLREIRPNEGNSPARNVYFLMTIDDILESQPGLEHEILSQILPYTRDQVRKFWQSLGSEKATWPEIVAKFIAKFFGIDDLRMVKEKFLFRAQRANEDLEEYVSNIRRAFKILAPNTPPGEIFETIFLKISTETRTSLNSVGVIKTIEELIQAAPRADTITKASRSQNFQQSRGTQPTPNPRTERNQYTGQHRHSRLPYTPRSGYPNQYPRTFYRTPDQHNNPAGFQGRTAFTPGFYDNSSQVQNRREQNRASNYRGRR